MRGAVVGLVALGCAVACGSADDDGLFGGTEPDAGRDCVAPPCVSSAGGAGGLGAGGRGQGGSAAVSGAASDASADCPGDQKRCGGACLPPEPRVGCGGPTCEPCPAPPENGMTTCVDGLCALSCLPGYVFTGTLCESADGSSSVGAGGAPTTGSGGAPGAAGGPPTGCPATEPQNFSGCATFSFSCVYGSVSCVCLLFTGIPIWYCA